DLEDCYSQATFELIRQAKRGTLRCSTRSHLRNTLEQRFLSRVHDRRRALAGRSPRELVPGTTVSLDAPGERSVDVADVRADVERTALLRLELDCLRLAARSLTDDQRLVLAAQLSLGPGREEFCRRLGWSEEKYRKVAQRGRERLRRSLAEMGL